MLYHRRTKYFYICIHASSLDEIYFIRARAAPMRCTWCAELFEYGGVPRSTIYMRAEYIYSLALLCVFIARAPPRNMVYCSIHVMHTRI